MSLQRFVNTTGTTLPAGLVSIYGFDRAAQLQTCVAALADGNSLGADGYLANAVPTGQTAEFARDWILTGTPTAPVDTSAVERGAPVYLSATTGGGWTLTPPAVRQIVGSVISVHATRGQIRFQLRSFTPVTNSPGGGGLGITAVNASPYAALDTDHILLVDASPCTITLLSVASARYTLTVKDRSGAASGSNPLTINAAGGETIDGEATAQIVVPYGSVTLAPNGTEWSII